MIPWYSAACPKEYTGSTGTGSEYSQNTQTTHVDIEKRRELSDRYGYVDWALSRPSVTAHAIDGISAGSNCAAYKTTAVVLFGYTIYGNTESGSAIRNGTSVSSAGYASRSSATINIQVESKSATSVAGGGTGSQIVAIPNTRIALHSVYSSATDHASRPAIAASSRSVAVSGSSIAITYTVRIATVTGASSGTTSAVTTNKTASVVTGANTGTSNTASVAKTGVSCNGIQPLTTHIISTDISLYNPPVYISPNRPVASAAYRASYVTYAPNEVAVFPERGLAL